LNTNKYVQKSADEHVVANKESVNFFKV
jgi:hypothetical protein